MKNLYNKALVLTIFCIAMGFLEAAVVVYLRGLYYPTGFNFPIKPMPGMIGIIEFLRELATIIMLGTLAWLTARSGLMRLAAFLWSFAVWDIFYYIWLKILLNWPVSFFSWDILFLIPVIWVGPVLAPLINSLSMMALAAAIGLGTCRCEKFSVFLREWVLLVSGAGLIFMAYIQDMCVLILKHRNATDFAAALSAFVPAHFNWWLLLAGQAIICLVIVLLFFRASGKSERLK
jgi:hypothetical protein